MLKRLKWREKAVFSLRLRDDLYTLAQMRKNHIMQFFALHNSTGDWDGIDLDAEKSLFFCFVAENKLKPLLVEEVDASRVRPSTANVPRVMLAAVIGAGTYGANLIELTPDYSSYGARVIKEGLLPDVDLGVICEHELVGMVGDPEKLRHRLMRFFDTGVNWDDSKSFLFKGIQPPSAKRV